MRVRPGPDAFAPFVEYVRARLNEDPHLWVATLADELGVSASAPVGPAARLG